MFYDNASARSDLIRAYDLLVYGGQRRTEWDGGGRFKRGEHVKHTPHWGGEEGARNSFDVALTSTQLQRNQTYFVIDGLPFFFFNCRTKAAFPIRKLLCTSWDFDRKKKRKNEPGDFVGRRRFELSSLTEYRTRVSCRVCETKEKKRYLSVTPDKNNR